MLNKILKIGFAFLLLISCFFLASCNNDEVKITTYDVVVNGGTGSGTYDEGTSITVVANVPSGSVFVDWKDGETSVSTDAAYTFTVNKDITLTANFEQIPSFTVTFKDGEDIVKTVTYSKGDTIIEAPEVPTKVGYTCAWEEYTLDNSNIIVNAVYTPVIYKAVFMADSKKISEVEFTIESTQIDGPIVPAKTGYEGVWEEYEIAAENLEIKAIYSAIDYNITLAATTNGTISIEGNLEKANYGDIIKVVCTPETGYEVNIIQVNGKAITGDSFKMPAENVEISVTFESKKDSYSYNFISYLSAKDIVDLSGQTAEAGQFNENYSFNEFVIGAGEKSANTMFYDKLNTKYTYDGHVFYGAFTTKGKTQTTLGRWVSVTPIADGVLTIYALMPGGLPDGNVHLLNNLVDPAEDETVINQTQVVATGTKVTHLKYDVKAGQTYYIWTETNIYYRGFKLEYTDPIKVKVDSISVDTSNAQLEFGVDKEFNSEGIVVTLHCRDNSTHIITDYVISTPDLSNPGKKTVTVSYGDYTSVSYEIDVIVITKYIATFVAEGATVEEVEFEVGQTSITAPAVPEKVGYTGVWEEYTLNDENITINAIYTAIKFNVEIGEIINGEIQVNCVDGQADYNTTVKITIIPDEGFQYKEGTLKLNGELLETLQFKMPAENVILTAEFEPAKDDLVIGQGTKYISADKVVEAAGITEPGVSGNLISESNIVFGDLVFVSNSTRYFKYDKLGTTYKFDGYSFNGAINSAGASGTAGRYMIVNASEDFKLTVYVLTTSSIGTTKLNVLNSLEAPNETNTVASYDVTTKATGIEISFVAGNTYYLWCDATIYFRGIKLEYPTIQTQVESLIIDTTSAPITFTIGEEFSFEGIVVNAVCTNGETYTLDSNIYSVVAPDMTTAGEKTVTVKYGDYTVANYTININE